jgi:hypothetical protein
MANTPVWARRRAERSDLVFGGDDQPARPPPALRAGPGGLNGAFAGRGAQNAAAARAHTHMPFVRALPELSSRDMPGEEEPPRGEKPVRYIRKLVIYDAGRGDALVPLEFLERPCKDRPSVCAEGRVAPARWDAEDAGLDEDAAPDSAVDVLPMRLKGILGIQLEVAKFGE